MTNLKEKLINLAVLVNKAYKVGTNKIGIQKVSFHGNVSLGFRLIISTEGEPIERDLIFSFEDNVVSSDKKIQILKVEDYFYTASGSRSHTHEDYFYKDKRICGGITENTTYYRLLNISQLGAMQKAAKSYNTFFGFIPSKQKETFEVIEVYKPKIEKTYRIKFGRISAELTQEDVDDLNTKLEETNNSTEFELLEKITELLK